MTWAIAHITQFVRPPRPTSPGGWKYIDSASGFLQGDRAEGSYVTLLRSTRDRWSSIIETTAGVTGTQRGRLHRQRRQQAGPQDRARMVKHLQLRYR